MKFSRKGTLEDSVGKFLKKAVTGEGAMPMRMEGKVEGKGRGAE
jgi:hypothetical protein